MGLLVKLLVFIVNIVIWVCGILMIVFGAIALASPSTIISVFNIITGGWVVVNLINVTPLFEGVAIFMIVLGSLVFLFGFVGCHGAFKMHKMSLMNYWILLILSVLTEIALIIYAAVFPPTMNSYVQTQLTTSLKTKFEPVTISGTTVTYSTNIEAASWEMLQSQTQCCGVMGYEDFSTFTWNAVSVPSLHLIPPTCCTSKIYDGKNITNTDQFYNLNTCLNTNPPTYYYTQPCWLVVINMVWQFGYLAIGLSVSLMVVQLFGIIITVHTWHKME
jgi:hypothetical protein